jgi:hypothetical protein
MVRIIHCSNESGSDECISILDDLSDPVSASDFCSPGQKVISDTTYDIKLPNSFPSGSTFQKQL